MANRYCETLGIGVPRLESVRDHPGANTYSLLIVCLLERGDGMTLAEAAVRFEEAGVAPAPRALLSLQRCKPARAPIYRDGARYVLDPRDHEADLWAFRLGLRGPRVPHLSLVRAQPAAPPRGDGDPLTAGELEETWRGARLYSWSAQRLALAVLDAHGRVMPPAAVIAFLDGLTPEHVLRRPESAARQFEWRGSAIIVRADGAWEIAPGDGALIAARRAVRKRLEEVRRRPPPYDPAVHAALDRARERTRARNAAELAALRRVVLHLFPPERPRAVVLADVAQRTLATFLEPDLQAARERLAGYDMILALDVRAALRGLAFDPGERRLVDLGPPQKSIRLNRRGRTLRITPELLVRGSCGIARPFGDPALLQQYLRAGELTRLRRRLEADAKALVALYEYGHLQGVVRLRWGFLDEVFPAPWRHFDEPGLLEMLRDACATGAPLDVVCGAAPGWSDPWSRARPFRVLRHPSGYGCTCCLTGPASRSTRETYSARGSPASNQRGQQADQRPAHGGSSANDPIG